MTTTRYFYSHEKEKLYLVDFGEGDETIDNIEEMQCLYEVGDYDNEEEVEAAKEHKSAEAPAVKKVRTCSICGQPGHTARKCPQKPEDAPPMLKRGEPVEDSFEEPTERMAAPAVKSLRQQVMEQRAEGVALDEMYELFPDHDMAEIAAVYRNIEQEENRI